MTACLLFLCVSAVVSPALGLSWEIEVIDQGAFFSEMTDRSLHLDSDGAPHIAYGGGHLYYAYHSGEEWQLEMADASQGVGRFATLDLDASGLPHIGYYDEPNGDLKYARRIGSEWYTMTLDTDGDDCTGRV